MPSSWRAASEPLTAFGIPVPAYLPLFGWMYFPSWTTFYMAVCVIIMFGILAKLGWTLSVCWNKLLGFLRGGVIYARPWWFRKRFRD